MEQETELKMSWKWTHFPRQASNSTSTNIGTCWCKWNWHKGRQICDTETKGLQRQILIKMNMNFWQFTRLHARWDCLFPSTVSSSPGVSPVARWQFTPFVNRRITSEVPLVCMSVPVQSEKGEGGCEACCSHSHVDSVASHTRCQLLDQVNVKYLMKNIEHVTSLVW